MLRFLRIAFCVLAAVFCQRTASAASPAVANASFESGEGLPAGWTATGNTAWGRGNAADGTRFVTVHTDGQWTSAPLVLKPGGTYELRLRYRFQPKPGAPGAYAVVGPDFGIQVVPMVAAENPAAWREHRLRFAAPDTAAQSTTRISLGQWRLQGTIDFDRVELYPVKLAHTKRGDMVLGEGESLSENRYRFIAPLETWRTVSRPLAGFTAIFHENRWRFAAAGRYVVYRHAVAGRRQTRVTATPSVWFHEPSSLRLRVEASTDGQTYRLLGTARNGEATTGYDLPMEMLPAETVWVRLSCDASDTSQTVFFQCTGYRYEATLDGTGPDGVGQTAALTVLGEDETLDVVPAHAAGEQLTMAVQVTNRGPAAVSLNPVLEIRNPQGDVKTAAGPTFLLAAGDTAPATVPFETAQPGNYRLQLRLGSGLKTCLGTEMEVCVLDVTSYGERLPSADSGVAVWWASAGWKVSRSRPVPVAQSDAVVVRLAGNETEGVQIVVHPDRPLRCLRASVGPLTTGSGDALPPSAVEFFAVDYVDVQHASDGMGRPGLWPDPLPPLGRGLTVPAGVNQPLLIRVQTPADTRPGLYKGQVTLAAEGFAAVVPLEVEVFGFTLPAESTCKTLFGFNSRNVTRYHNLKTDADRRLVVEKYLRSFAEHRISPYNPTPLDGFSYEWQVGSRWNGARITKDRPHAGRSALLCVDASETQSPQVSYRAPVLIGTAPLRLSAWYRTDGTDRAQVVMSYQDAAGNHIPNQNKHAPLPASPEWRQVELTFAGHPAGAVAVVPSFLGCEWTPDGEKTGTVWIDDVSLVDSATRKELLLEGDFEVADFVAGKDLVTFDWTRWDQAMDRAVNEYHFNSFLLRVPGLGGGTFHARHAGELCGYAEGTPEYAALLKAWCDGVRTHPADKGLLERAVVYPFDEPAEKDYAFVCSQLRRLKDNFPGLRRMVPMNLGAVDDFLGLIDLWCPIMNSHNREFATARRRAGELYTWYICCAPKAPYIANFIDRPGTDLRLWLWQTWQEQVDGILIWETVWWTSGAAYPDTPQNPYADSMSWVDGYGTPRGTKRRWNVGDGRFLYPPRGATGTQAEAVLDGPVSSLRWEALRDGVEDFEYLVTLRRLLKEQRATLPAAEIARCENLLVVPPAISRSLTDWTKDPAPIEKRRCQVAAAIQELMRQR